MLSLCPTSCPRFQCSTIQMNKPNLSFVRKESNAYFLVSVLNVAVDLCYDSFFLFLFFLIRFVL